MECFSLSDEGACVFMFVFFSVKDNVEHDLKNKNQLMQGWDMEYKTERK